MSCVNLRWGQGHGLTGQPLATSDWQATDELEVATIAVRVASRPLIPALKLARKLRQRFARESFIATQSPQVCPYRPQRTV